MSAPPKPFIKWAGGKRQLLDEIRNAYPKGLGQTITKYAEPFVGGGAVLFDILGSHHIKETHISDVNASLIHTYCTVRDNCDDLMAMLADMRDAYLAQSGDERKTAYYAARTRYNALKNSPDKGVELAALFIFLNKTGFNGLYRENRNGEFNVPAGTHSSLSLFEVDSMRAASHALRDAEIMCADYHRSLDFVDEHTFVYLDPPYRPLSGTSSFTAYHQTVFDDAAQIGLAAFVKTICNKGAKVLLSNSDPKNTNKDDLFFDELYAGLTIRRVMASRAINSNAKARGTISELLISNYSQEGHT